MKSNNIKSMTASEIRKVSLEVFANDLRRVPEALIETSVRTEKARLELRQAIKRREEMQYQTRPIQDLIATRKRNGQKVSPSSRGHFQVSADQKDQFSISLARRLNNFCQAKIITRQINFLDQNKQLVMDAYAKCNYRRSASQWAGGHHNVRIECGSTSNAIGFSTRTTSTNGKWTGTNSVHVITINESYNKIPESLRVARFKEAYQVVLDAEPSQHKGVWKVTWVGQSRGFDLKLMKGTAFQAQDGKWHLLLSEKVACQLKLEAGCQDHDDCRECLELGRTCFIAS